MVYSVVHCANVTNVDRVETYLFYDSDRQEFCLKTGSVHGPEPRVNRHA